MGWVFSMGSARRGWALANGSVGRLIIATQHRHLDPPSLRCFHRFWVARIGMTHDTHARVGGQDTFEAAGCFGGTIGDDDLPGVLGEANPYAAPVVETDPGGPHQPR